MALVDHLIHTASVSRTSERLESGGGMRTEDVLISEGLACRFVDGAPRDAQGGGIAWAHATGVVYFGAGVDVQRNDMLSIDATELRVIGVQHPSVRTTYLKAIVEEQLSGATYG